MSRKKVKISDLDLNIIGDRFTFVRLTAAKRQDDFAETIGISKTTASNIENHIHEPSFSTLNNLIQEYGINSKWLLTGEGEPYMKDKPAEEAVLYTSKGGSIAEHGQDASVELGAITKAEAERRKAAVKAGATVEEIFRIFTEGDEEINTSLSSFLKALADATRAKAENRELKRVSEINERLREENRELKSEIKDLVATLKEIVGRDSPPDPNNERRKSIPKITRLIEQSRGKV